MTVSGLYLEPDTSPYTGTTLSALAALVDSVLYTPASGNYWYVHYSYGIDLGSALTISKLTASGSCTVTPTGYYAGHDSFKVFKSDDNSTWTLIEQFDAPTIIHSAANQWGIDFVFSANQTARYFKIVYIDATTLAFNPGGASAKIGEIEYTEVAADTYVTLTESLTVQVSLSADISGIYAVDLAGTPLSVNIDLNASLKVEINLQSTLNVQVGLNAIPGYLVSPDPLNVDVSMSIGAIVMLLRELLDRDSKISKVFEANSPITKVLERDSLISDLDQNSIIGT